MRDFIVIFDNGLRMTINGAHVTDALERHGVKRIDIKAVIEERLFRAFLGVQDASDKLANAIGLTL